MRMAGRIRASWGWAVAAALAIAGPGVASGAAMEWNLRDGDAGPLLAWEQPDTDNQPLFLVCDAGRRMLRVNLVHEPADARDGMTVQTAWSSEGGRIELAMQGQRMELDDLFILSGETRLTPEFARLFAEGRTLTVRIGDRAETIPLQGSEAGVAALLQRCG